MASAGSHEQRYPSMVGRSYEMEVVRASLEQARTGHGQLVLISGEPGIGKTRLAIEGVEHAQSRGIAAYWGHCFEWAGTPAYWPWIEILRDLIDTQDPDVLRSCLDQNAPLIAQIVPELSEVAPDLPSVAPINPEQARFRLFDGVTRLLVQLARQQPVVIVLEDLHWADPASLLLLEFLSHELADAPMLVIGTYRDVEVRRDHPLAATLASLSRIQTTKRLSLTGLGRNHVTDLIREMSGIEPPEHSVDDISHETEGNPFFITEVVRFLIDQQYFERPTERGNNWNVAIPESVREAIGRRLDRLSERCNELLRIASVVGREFDLAVLQHVSDLPLDDLLATMDEAIEARVIEEREQVGRYRFAHALVQETLYDELSSSRRLRVHGQVGEALEHEHHRNLAPHYGDLARHFRLSPFGENLDKAINYGGMAGDQAMDQVAWESAVGHYQRAVELLETHPNPNPARLCEMLLKLAEAQGRAGVSRGRALGAGVDPVSRETSMHAAKIAREANLTELWAKAALAVAGLNPWANVSVETMQLMYDALCALSPEDSHVRARLLSRLSRAIYLHMVLFGTERVPGLPSFEKSLRLSGEAIEMARRLDDPAALSHALLMRPVTFTGPVEEIDEQLRITEEQLHAARRADDQVALLWGNAVKNCFLIQRGEIQASNQLAERLPSHGELLKLPLMDWLTTIHRVGRALRTGQYDEADELIERANHVWPNSIVTKYQRFILERELDQVSGTTKGTVEPGSIPPMIRFPFAIVHLLETGRHNEARARMHDIEFQNFLKQPKTTSWIRGLTLLSEVCAELGDSESTVLVYDALNPFSHQNHSCEGFDDKSGGCVAYYLGLLATTLERWDDAEHHFAVSLELNQRWGFPPYVAHTQYAWADMLFRRKDVSDRDRATRLLKEAKTIAQQIGMVRLLRRIAELERRSGIGKRAHTAGLTAREMEVLRLLVQGKSDREIGEELFISHHTVMRHVSSILRKLNVESRAAAAVQAVRRGLV